MKHILSFNLLASFLLLFTCSQAQEVKTKTKANKTKAKSTPGSPNTSGTASAAGTIPTTPALTNTSWMTYFGDPINDTLVLHFAVDSSSVQSKTSGLTVISSVYKRNQDTVTFNDLSGQYACPSDQVGKYRININGDVMKLDLITDDCEGRAAATKEVNWQRVKQTAAQ